MRTYRVTMRLTKENGGAKGAWFGKADSHRAALQKACWHIRMGVYQDFQFIEERVLYSGEVAILFADHINPNFKIDATVVQEGSCSDGGCA